MSFETDDNNPWGKKRGSAGNGSPFDDFIKMARRYMKQGGTGPVMPGSFNPGLIAGGIAGVALLLWLSTGFYIVDAKEQGVVLRFGEFNRISNPGLNYKWPSPIEVVYTPSVKSVNSINSVDLYSLTKKTDAPDNRFMVTGDENIVNIEFIIQWKIKDAREFVLNTRSPEPTLRSAGESVMREVIGQTPISPIFSGENWQDMSTQSQKILQALCDNYKLGIEVVEMKLQKASPPVEVNEAFQDVQNAKTDESRLKNEAEAHRNDILPRARAEVIRITQDAQAYKEALVAQAQGEASRFTAVLSEYEKNPEVTLKRMQLENMKKVFEKNQKVFIDPLIGKNILQVLPQLDLKKTEGK